jgi:hypothetical protein
MNKPINQLELVPSDPVRPAADPLSSLTPEQQQIVDEYIAEAKAEEADDFEWNVVKPRPGIAVYRNKFDDVVIRVQGADGDGMDSFSYIRPEALPAVIKALQGELP